MNWQRLDRDAAGKVIESVRSAVDPGLFSPATSEVQRARLPFYQGADLYRLTNFASLPSFTFEYLGYDDVFFYLDGTEQPVYAVNDRGTLSLDDKTVMDYLDFFFSHVVADNEETVLVRNAGDMPFLESLGADSIASITGNHRPAAVSYDAGFDVYTVEADLYAESLLMRATIEVDAKGRVSVQSRKMIMNAIAQGSRPGVML